MLHLSVAVLPAALAVHRGNDFCVVIAVVVSGIIFLLRAAVLTNHDGGEVASMLEGYFFDFHVLPRFRCAGLASRTGSPGRPLLPECLDLNLKHLLLFIA